MVDNHYVRILLPTLVVQFLISEARGLLLGFLGAFGFQRVLFRVRHLYDFARRCVFASELLSLRGVFASESFLHRGVFAPEPFPQPGAQTPVPV